MGGGLGSGSSVGRGVRRILTVSYRGDTPMSHRGDTRPWTRAPVFLSDGHWSGMKPTAQPDRPCSASSPPESSPLEVRPRDAPVSRPSHHPLLGQGGTQTRPHCSKYRAPPTSTMEWDNPLRPHVRSPILSPLRAWIRGPGYALLGYYCRHFQRPTSRPHAQHFVCHGAFFFFVGSWPSAGAGALVILSAFCLFFLL